MKNEHVSKDKDKARPLALKGEVISKYADNPNPTIQFICNDTKKSDNTGKPSRYAEAVWS